jgi:hypothetical protein
VDLSFIPLLEATLNNLWNCVGVGDMVFTGDYIFTIWPTFNIKGGSCDVIASLQGLLFRLRWDAENRADLILSHNSLPPLTFIFELGITLVLS